MFGNPANSNPVWENEGVKTLTKTIAQYTDELLKRAIPRCANGEALSVCDDLSAELGRRASEMLSSVMPKPSVVLEGISWLYTVDAERGNARMQQYFETVQQIPDLDEQLRQCYGMLRCLCGMGWSPYGFGCATGGAT